MLAFDATCPFPLLEPGSHTYAEAQEYSEKVDAWLGLRTHSIEARLSQGSYPDQIAWIGLPVRSLLTPYPELRQILEQLAPTPGSTIVDLGAGYGRMGFVVAEHFPEVAFIGYELVQERVDEALRCLRLRNVPERIRMKQADLLAPGFVPEPASFYFLYDFGSREAIEKTLQDLRTIARNRAITVVGRGRSSRDGIERRHPWLSQVVEPEHHGHYSIYRSAPAFDQNSGETSTI